MKLFKNLKFIMSVPKFPLRPKRPRRLTIRLEYGTLTLFEVESSAIVGNLTIGRSQSCKWKLSPDDKRASGHHAVITMLNGKLYIRDTGSRNGLHVNGKRVYMHILTPGDKISLGAAFVTVAESKESQEVYQISSLQVLNGPDTGKIIELNPPKMIIGSTPACDLPIMDPMISQNHAQINITPDGCTIRDTNSKNGSTLNGTPLVPLKDYPLEDGDIITLVHVDFVFLDESSRPKPYIFVKVMIIILLVIVFVLAGYCIYRHWNDTHMIRSIPKEKVTK